MDSINKFKYLFLLGMVDKFATKCLKVSTLPGLWGEWLDSLKTTSLFSSRTLAWNCLTH